MNEEASQTECNICHVETEPEEEIQTLCCRQPFCASCLASWFNYSDACPKCRRRPDGGMITEEEFEEILPLCLSNIMRLIPLPDEFRDFMMTPEMIRLGVRVMNDPRIQAALQEGTVEGFSVFAEIMDREFEPPWHLM